MNWTEMSLKEINDEIQKLQLNNIELETFKSGKDMIDKAIYLSEEESKRTVSALLMYMIYKVKENNN